MPACGSPPAMVHFQGETMGTFYTVTIADEVEARSAARLGVEIDHVLAEINRRMSTYLPDSELSRVNRSPSTDWQTVSPELLFVLQRAYEISVLSDGAFDVTVAPIVNLWGFGPDKQVRLPPDAELVRRASESVGYRLLSMRSEPPAVRKHKPALYIDLSAIAKGYAVDRLAEVLRTYQLEHYLIDVGGELYASGMKAEGKPWQVAIEKPDSESDLPLRVVSLSDHAIATSGDYRNYVEVGGKRYSHTIDPHTAAPVSHATALVSVVSEDAITADAMATALLVLGEASGRDWAERRRIAAYFVSRRADGTLRASWSSAFSDFIER